MIFHVQQLIYMLSIVPMWQNAIASFCKFCFWHIYALRFYSPTLKKAISHQLSLSVVYFNPDHHSTQCPTTALHWLQENVQEFGGDPTSVTLMGHGTGAACATFLMTSPAVLDGKSMKQNLCLTVPIYLELLSSVLY